TQFKWSAKDDGDNRAVRISQRGEIEGMKPGTYKVIVEGGGRRAGVKVTTVDGPQKRKPTDKPTSVQEISNRDRPVGAASQAPRQTRRQENIAQRATRISVKSPIFAHGRRISVVMPMPIAPD